MTIEDIEDIAVGSGVTRWRMIADDLARAIVDGEVQPGARLPGEMELAGRYGVHRHTVRRALAALSERGLVRASQGRGTFVETGRVSYRVGARTRFSENVGRAGLTPAGRLIAGGEEPASDGVAEALRLAPGTPVIRLLTLREANGVPLCASLSYLPASRVPDFHLVYAAKGSISAALATFGIEDYRRMHTRIVATLADAVDAERLDVAPGRPVLVVEGLDAERGGAVIQVIYARFAADRVEMAIGPGV